MHSTPMARRSSDEAERAHLQAIFISFLFLIHFIFLYSFLIFDPHRFASRWTSAAGVAPVPPAAAPVVLRRLAGGLWDGDGGDIGSCWPAAADAAWVRQD